ncbi:MAG TPA: class I SAM-dependent methyltransferase [Herpetosiphon sp.]|uniref:Methyltransferase type 11 n=1 Tax=Herpetosiphon aurantiacus (strain ATCC 23779 / DSM 785 / 114-95) TaxID=316274 RepID=A9B4P7_HERA2|nr:class I SAM-dependent methyltransferase [Herpetosiphon sp.]ABX04212.1 Methyltransferase type 11 [Herpetosiphon aurantiacus DSM 785]HBW51363.1 class I SAM-dependent methyltransferase [Herpetosiphon sp.]
MVAKDMDWTENYTTIKALDARHDVWKHNAAVDGPFGPDLVPALKPDTLVLDAGCGTGVHLRTLIDRYPQARFVAMDTSEAMVAATRERCPEAEVVGGTITQLAWEDHHFAGTTCLHVLYHVPDIHQAVSELARVTQKGGWAVISTVADDAGQESLRLHNAACAEAHASEWQIEKLPSARFNTANGEQFIRPYFSQVTLYPRYAALYFTEVAAVLKYYTSMDYYQQIYRANQALAEQVVTKARQLVEAQLHAKGEFQISKNVGTWLAFK